jgi:NAD(P)-dependent dehydrogenase (short-subunit alcohol dehydrogenase family)
VVTGAASGIGAAFCEHLLDLGLPVVAVDRDAAALAHRWEGVHRDRLRQVALDVTDEPAWEALAASLSRPVHVVCLCAGVGAAGFFVDMQAADWSRVMAVNVQGVVLALRHLHPLLPRHDGARVLVVGSGAGALPRPGMTVYAASKHAVTGLTLSLRAEWADDGVGVTLVQPGYIDTGILGRTTWRRVDGAAVQRAIPIRPVPAAECARQMVEGARADRAVVWVGGSVRLEALLWRLSPDLVMWLSRVRARSFRRARQD